MPKASKLSNKKTHKQSFYRGVDKRKEGWITEITINNKKYRYGPFDTEEEAAKKYDEVALEHFKDRAILNILESPYPPRPRAIRPRYRRRSCKNSRTKRCKILNRTIHKRKQFSVVTRNRVCSNQKWSCNYCKKLLSDVFIVDHVVPLFLGGTNEEYNLQALCPSCDRYKTSHIDHHVLRPMAENKELTNQDVYQAQNDHYHKMMCIEPNTMIDDKVVNNINNNGETINVNCQQYITNNSNGGKDLELNIGGIKLKIQI